MKRGIEFVATHRSLTSTLFEMTEHFFKLWELWLHENEIGDDGVAALLRAAAAGAALPELTFLTLDRNRIDLISQVGADGTPCGARERQ